jgi:5-(carboxyamino)imidazole ribonucleotide synthase
LGFSSSVLAFTEDSMAKGFADRCVVASPTDVSAVAALLASSDILTFEVEAVPESTLQEIGRAAAAGQIRVAPSIAVMELLKDKLLQKQWLQREGFATAEFLHCADDVRIADLAETLGLPFVQKAHQGGYDGKGVQIIHSAEQADKLWRGAALAERFVADKRELSVLAARSESGEVRCYPAVEMLFEPAGHVLLQAQSPAALPQGVEAQARGLAHAIVERLQGVGLFAVEMFLTGDGELLVNEISPRVHNTGHLTIEAHGTSQYEQHLRAISGLPLGDVAQHSAAVMRNILHSDALRGMPTLPCGTTRLAKSTNVHWYGKQGAKQFRKMGHITSLGDDVGAAAKRAEEAEIALVQTPGKAV